jgi:hypothetical protein
LTSLGHDCFYFAGEVDFPSGRSYVVPEAHLAHPDVELLHDGSFGRTVRSPEALQAVRRLKEHLKTHLHRFADGFDLNLVIAENAFAIPMNVPLGLALTEFVAEREIPPIAHHHDFAWE